ncbi:uncharacterized protein CTHT_0072390 [Thermochaetoides thermophila DSM 1495]|uniref:DUF4604 domain-containing protein n=1 Tax=Chaetomium thermophilum (strain DSM 1495 / CBS 144.50 / IMI 039719) TaxID=759272 RepID=G0SFW6_CHATD|nr:hypothetical protein CTHT_0072390 [Thermochaetoides thermophila DSM 1495]EGS17881.1 hypothetical protein CTHT_0072390 [Thermochaetoides thermophila DSM 1495]
MSNFNAKNLQYHSAPPPFLARLKGEASCIYDPSRPDPILVSNRRAAKPRSASEEAEDLPVVVDERGEVVEGVVVGKDGDFKGMKGEDKGEVDMKSRERVEGQGEGEGNMGEKKGVVASIGAGRAGKKRKARVVGGGVDDEGDKDDKRGDGDNKKREVKTGKTSEKADEEGAKSEVGTAKPAKMKKAKKIKLSFGEDEG